MGRVSYERNGVSRITRNLHFCVSLKIVFGITANGCLMGLASFWPSEITVAQFLLDKFFETSSSTVSSVYIHVHLIPKWRQYYFSFMVTSISPLCLDCTCWIQNVFYSERMQCNKKKIQCNKICHCMLTMTPNTSQSIWYQLLRNNKSVHCIAMLSNWLMVGSATKALFCLSRCWLQVI